MNPVDTISKSKIWMPVAYVGGIIAVAALAWTAVEVNKTMKTAKNKEDVKKGLEEVKEVLVSENFSGCRGCSGVAGDGGRQFPMKESLKYNAEVFPQGIDQNDIYSGMISPKDTLPRVYS